MHDTITVSILTIGGDHHSVEVPIDIRVRDFIQELIAALGLPTTDAEGLPISWRLDDKDLGTTLDYERTLETESVVEGHRLMLIRATVAGGARELVVPQTVSNLSLRVIPSIGPNPFVSLLWWCAGAIPSVLRRVPTAWNKYAGIGFSVLATSLVAAFSAGYAMNSVTGSIWLPCLFALVWGSLILNIDRFIVSTLILAERPAIEPPVVATRFVRVVPRLILAVLIALTIAKPLELALFRDDIQQQIREDHAVPLADLRRNLSLQQAELSRLNERLQFQNAQLTRLSEALIAEVSGAERTGRPGEGPVYRRLEQERQEALAIRVELEKQLTEKQSEVAILKDQDDYTVRAEQLSQTSLLSRIEAFGVMVQKDQRVAVANYTILLLILVLEICPIVVLLVSPEDEYTSKLNELSTASTGDLALRTNQVAADVRNVLNRALDDSLLNPKKEK